MLKWGIALALALSACTAALADGEYRRYRPYLSYIHLPPERHVIEVVQPPSSGRFTSTAAIHRQNRHLSALGRWRADQARCRGLERSLRRRGILQRDPPLHLRDVVPLNPWSSRSRHARAAQPGDF